MRITEYYLLYDLLVDLWLINTIEIYLSGKKYCNLIKEYSYNRNLPNSYSTTVLI